MNAFDNAVGVLVPEVLLPKPGTDISKWAVVACDQFTSQPEYWAEAARYIGSAPSTLELILPEAFLGKPEEEAKIASIRTHMKEYVADGVLAKQPRGFVLVTRSVAGKTRTGLVMALDLEAYDYNKGATTLIRATEGTIVSRIPPRLKIREGAPLELPHILVLIDDPDRTVIEPLAGDKGTLPLLYDADLMQGGGHVEGRLVSEEKKVTGVLSALTKLCDRAAFAKKYGESAAPLLFAMGDGNHSFATAKAYWEKIKATLPADRRANHPARYALVEVENVHDAGIEFEPIHRVVFGLSGDAGIEKIRAALVALNGDVRVVTGKQAASGGESHILPFITGFTEGAFVVKRPVQQLAVGTLQAAIDLALKETPDGSVDYIHGADVVRELAEKPGAIGFLLPAMGKEELFPTVVYDGALPRKTFSMGEAAEKRYYMECRRIEP